MRCYRRWFLYSGWLHRSMLLLQLATHLSPVLIYLCFLFICSHFCFMDFTYYLWTFWALCLPPPFSPTYMPLFTLQSDNVDLITIICTQASPLWERRPFLISKPTPGLVGGCDSEGRHTASHHEGLCNLWDLYELLSKVSTTHERLTPEVQLKFASADSYHWGKTGDVRYAPKPKRCQKIEE